MQRNFFQIFFMTDIRCRQARLELLKISFFLEDIMSKVAKTVLAALFVSCLLACKPDAKPSIKTAQEKIEADIRLDLQESMAEMGLSGVKLKNAPKDSGNTWVGVATFGNEGGKFDQDITALYNGEIRACSH